MFLETERLILRKFQEEDFAEFLVRAMPAPLEKLLLKDK